MKTLFSFLMIGGLLFAGCKKDNNTNTNNTPKTYLLKTTTYTVMPFNNSTTDQYTYDDKNRVISFKSNGGDLYKYTYDDNNNLATVQNYNQAGTLFSTNNYSYSSSRVSVQTNDVGDNGGQPYIFTLNSLGQVSASTIEGSQQFTYDNNGNLTQYSQCCVAAQSDNYTYDNKKHPLSMIGAKNFHLMYIAFGDPTTFVNNIITDASMASPYTYVYNSDGFPISASTAPTASSSIYIKITYDYIVK